MLILIDGPERSGKTTIANAMHDNHGATIRHWGPIDPDDRVYTPYLQQDIASNKLTVWDRAWPAEYVYATLLHRDRRLRDDAWLGEWIHGRAVASYGARAIILGPSVERLAALRTDDDLPVDPGQERELYEEYGHRFGYEVYEQQHTPEAARSVAQILAYHAVDQRKAMNRVGATDPSILAGGTMSPILVVGEKKATQPTIPGSWLPFSSRLATEFARTFFGDDAIKVAWSNANECPLAYARAPWVKAIIACGKIAQKWAVFTVQDKPVINVPNPAWLLRFKRGGEEAENVKRKIRAVLKQLVG